jgi:hypothetical protein
MKACPKCQDLRGMLQIARSERDHYKRKIDTANKALFFAQALINELEAKRHEPDIIKNCVRKLKVLIPKAEEPVNVKFTRKEKIGGG